MNEETIIGVVAWIILMQVYVLLNTFVVIELAGRYKNYGAFRMQEWFAVGVLFMFLCLAVLFSLAYFGIIK